MAKPTVYWMAERSERTHAELDVEGGDDIRIHLDEADNALVLAMTVDQRLVVERLLVTFYNDVVVGFS